MRIGPRVKLALLGAIFAAPIAASLITYRFFPPASTANYGELLLPPKTLAPALRQPFGERWLILASGDANCGPACEDKLAAMRQVRLALGRNASRVETLIVGPAEMARAGVPIDAGHIYLVDPHGNVMMRWPAAPDMKRMLKDLERLLKASQIG